MKFYESGRGLAQDKIGVHEHRRSLFIYGNSNLRLCDISKIKIIEVLSEMHHHFLLGSE